MILRPYQQRLVEAVFEKWRQFRSTLIVAATGTGKTEIFATIIERNQPGRTLVLAHRTELIQQAREKIERRGLPCEIEKADLYATTNLFHATPVVVSSIQTQCSGPKDNRRYKRFNPKDFSLLVCDEGHHACSPSWKEVIDYYRQNPTLKVLGVTATPDRADSEALGQVFESVAGTYDILDAIQDGY
ncbi:MAG TPA: DEAD/DEAH box helicase family protein, partial [Candidatus Saccharimonadia bacterium]|nr:DEAD/DEAH box helicase family protein [Candidatus Saccharimonadia bacterium]